MDDNVNEGLEPITRPVLVPHHHLACLADCVQHSGLIQTVPAWHLSIVEKTYGAVWLTAPPISCGKQKQAIAEPDCHRLVPLPTSELIDLSNKLMLKEFELDQLIAYSIPVAEGHRIGNAEVYSLKSWNRPTLCLPREYVDEGCQVCSDGHVPRVDWDLAS